MFLVSDDSPHDFSDLQPSQPIEIPSGAKTVVDGLRDLESQIPTYPAALLEWEEAQEEELWDPTFPIPEQLRGNVEVVQAVEQYRRDAQRVLQEFDSVLERVHFGIEPLQNFDQLDMGEVGWRFLREFFDMVAFAERLRGDTEAASLVYRRLLRFGTRFREEGSVSYLHFVSATGIEMRAWAALQELRYEGPLAPEVETDNLQSRSSSPHAFPISDAILREFQIDAGTMDLGEVLQEMHDVPPILARFLKPHRCRNLYGQFMRRALEICNEPYYRRPVIEPFRSTRWSRVSTLNWGELLVVDASNSLLGVLQRNDLAQREREAGRLLLAVDRYRREQGKLPSDLTTLYASVPDLQPEPIDPMTGESYLYDPEAGEIRSEVTVEAVESLFLGWAIEPKVWSVYGTDPDAP